MVSVNGRRMSIDDTVPEAEKELADSDGSTAASRGQFQSARVA